MHDLSEMNSRVFSFVINVGYDFPFTDSFNCIVSKSLNHPIFVILVVGGEIFSVGTGMYSCCRVSYPHLKTFVGAVRQYYWSLGYGFHCIVVWAFLSFEPIWILTFLSTSFSPTSGFSVACLVAIFTLEKGFSIRLKHQISLFSSGSKSLSSVPLGVELGNYHFWV